MGQLAKADLTAAARGHDVGLIRHQTLEGVDSYDASTFGRCRMDDRRDRTGQ